MRVLLVEDEPYMADAIRDGLRLEAIAADIAGDGDSALELLSVNAYDIAVLDRDIPGPSGDEIAKRIVASGSGMPILMLTAADRLDDKTTGFGLGADDYLTKPFELQELVLRLRALDRRRATAGRRCERSAVCVWIRFAVRSTATAATWRSPASSSPCSRSSSPPKAASSAPKNYSNGRGIKTPTRSPTPCASRSRHCANASANPGSSPPWPAPATASTRNQTPGARQASVDRAPGLSARLKLTLSYAGFLMLAGAVLLAAGYFSLSRGVHPGVVFIVRSHADLLREFAPIAAIVLAFLLVFGLLGGWLLAGRMLAPLTRITDATRLAATGSLSHRIELEGRQDEFREL